MNITIERKKSDCTALPKGWQREEVMRKSGLSAGKVDVFYYSPSGGKVETKSKLIRQLGDAVDLSTFDYQTGRTIQNSQSSLLYQQHLQQQQQQRNSLSTSVVIPSSSSSLKRTFDNMTATTTISSSLSSSSSTPPNINSSGGTNSTSKHQFEYSRGIRTDVSLVPPIRQTASIFKQPVTVYKTQEVKVKNDLVKHGAQQEKPKQLFWEKRLEGLRACDVDGMEFGPVELPKGLKPVGPNVDDGTLLQSVATALHVTTLAVTGQTASKNALAANSGVFLNPEQPLMHSINITEDDIRRQEDRVTTARRKLQDALKV